ncbi:MAG TPA: translation elongation factor Ts [Thermomicrobiales bacterium]|nr:translation elongation factor Ts [Thermomicrobiales bacterium]
MAITTEQVRALRDKTGAGIMDSKRALENAGGDITRATEILRQQGLARAGKKSDRSALQGLVEPYIHGGGRIGALIEINCETDFVARTPDFQTLAHDVAMQVAAIPPRYVTVDDVPEDAIPALEKEFGSKDEAFKQVVLMEQTFIKDAKKTINDIVREGIAKLGENIVVRRFARFELGAGQNAEGAVD